MLARDKREILLEYMRRYGIMLLFMCAMSFVLYNGIQDVTGLDGRLKMAIFLVGVLIMLSGVICMIIFEKDLHKFYIIFFVLLGGFYFFIYPIGTVPDEYAHFYRAYEISEGHLVSDILDGWGGRDLPENLSLDINTMDTSISEMWEKADVELSEERSFHIFWTMSLYAPVSYIPQSLGIILARLFTKSIVALFMAGRLFNFAAVAIISYLAVKYIPIGKKIVIMVMLLPMNMQEAISLAPDAMVTALTLAFVAYILHLRYGQQTVMSKKQLVLLYIMAIAISLYKIVYLPFCILPFLIPMGRFGGKKQFIIHAICMGTCVIAAGLGWLSFAGRYLMDIEGGRDSDAQVAYILSDLPNYFKIMATTTKQMGVHYFYTMIGHALSWMNIYIPKPYLVLYAAMLVLGLFSEERLPEKFGVVRGMLLLVVISVFLLTMTSLYVQWTDYAKATIDGVQGRYFIPLILPVLLIISVCLPHSSGKIFSMKNLIMPVITINLIVLTIVFESFLYKETGWVEDSNGHRYNTAESGYIVDSWRQIDGLWYYFDEAGYMMSDEWLELDGKKYLLSESGAMLVGWQLYNNEYYYLSADGSAYTGWVEADGEWYYCDDGKMLYDCVTPDGYKLDKDGKWIKD